MTTLIQRLQQPDMTGLDAVQAAAALNAPDLLLPPVPIAFSCKSIANAAVLTGELAVLRIAAARGEIPADLTSDSVAVSLPTRAIAAIMTVLDAVDRDLEADPAVVNNQVVNLLDSVETMGLLSPETRAAILSKTIRSPSWAEVNGVTVTADTVAIARAGLQAVTVLGWQNNGPGVGGGVEEQANLRFQNGAEVGVILQMPMANNAALRTAALNQWLINNANNLLS